MLIVGIKVILFQSYKLIELLPSIQFQTSFSHLNNNPLNLPRLDYFEINYVPKFSLKILHPLQTSMGQICSSFH